MTNMGDIGVSLGCYSELRMGKGEEGGQRGTPRIKGTGAQFGD